MQKQTVVCFKVLAKTCSRALQVSHNNNLKNIASILNRFFQKSVTVKLIIFHTGTGVLLYILR